MNRRFLAVGAAGVLVAFAFAAPGLADNPHVGSGTGNSSSSTCSGGGDGTMTASPAILWPPKHNGDGITITYAENGGTGDKDNDTISLSKITVSALDMGSPSTNVNGEGPGSGPPGGPDYSVVTPLPAGVPDTQTWPASGNPLVTVVAERAGTNGNGSGRVYTITGTCNDSGGSDPTEMSGGTATVHVCVPHDQSLASRNFCLAATGNQPAPS